MVYYLSSGRNYGISDMSLDNLKKHQVGPVSAFVLLTGIPIAVLLLSMIIGFSMKPSSMSDVDPKDSSKRVANKGKVFGFSLLYALIAGAIAFGVVKAIPDAPVSE
jgi:hypothetical protein